LKLDGDFVGGNREQLPEVALGALACCEDVIGAGHRSLDALVVVALPGRRHELGISKKREVMHGDQVTACASQRRDEIWAV
jgi:hypothetical protein